MICVLYYIGGPSVQSDRVHTYITAHGCKNSICQCQGNKICNVYVQRYIHAHG